MTADGPGGLCNTGSETVLQSWATVQGRYEAMPKSIIARVTYRGSDFTYSGSLEATAVVISSTSSDPTKEPSLRVEIRGDKGFLRSAALVIPASAAAALGGALLSAAVGGSQKSELTL